MAKSEAPSASWSVAQHDTIPQVDLWFNPLETHTYLSAFLRAEGEQFSAPYTSVRNVVQTIIDDRKARERKGQQPKSDVAPSRLRTWKSVFENLGFLSVDETDSRITLTPLGRAVRTLYDEHNRRIEGANDRLAKLGTTILSRHLLRNPIEPGSYPEDCNLRAMRFIWRAMRKLDNKLHHEEMNRVIMRVLREGEAEAAIEHIRAVRRKIGGAYDSKNVNDLGPPTVTQGKETTRRITPWFACAGFGGLLIDAEGDADGFRHLSDKYLALVDEAIQENVAIPPGAHTSAIEYLRYLTNDLAAPISPPDPDDESDLKRVRDALSKFGASKIVCLSGLPGTGKSRLAKIAATQITGADPYRFGEIQFHESTSYDDFIEGFVPKPSGEGFELVRKIFRIMNRRARLDMHGSVYVLLIEELTRANIHAVLGELITYVEHRNRPFRLALSQEEESVAPNIVFIATMNPRDKSALVLDHAILRRLHQIPMEPSVDRLKAMLDGKLDADILRELSAWFENHMASLPFGHGVFSDVRKVEDLKEVWTGTIRHFLNDASGEIREPFRVAADQYPWK